MITETAGAWQEDCTPRIRDGYLGELNLEREMEIGHGIASGDGRVFRVLSMSTAGPAANRLRRLEVVESKDVDYEAHLRD
jgi:hypothetical protein